MQFIGALFLDIGFAFISVRAIVQVSIDFTFHFTRRYQDACCSYRELLSILRWW